MTARGSSHHGFTAHRFGITISRPGAIGYRACLRDGVFCIFSRSLVSEVPPSRGMHQGVTPRSSLPRDALFETLASVIEHDAEVLLAVADASQVPPQPWGVEVIRQADPNWGTWLERILDGAAASHSWAVALGIDSTALPSARRMEAVHWLASRGGPDAVLGPTADGGYDLLGVRHVVPGAFDAIRWQTEHTLEDTETRLQRLGYVVQRLACGNRLRLDGRVVSVASHAQLNRSESDNR